MPVTNQIRGAILEEIVLYLLELVGYRVVQVGEDGTRERSAGLEVQGRGDWHQIDGLAAFDKTPAFMYPLRLMVEAKCYASHRRIGIDIVRNSVGVLKDITENYFSHKTAASPDEIQIPRFNYHSAIFSTSKYSGNAQRYAIAHQIFLIQYENVPTLKPIIEALLGLTAEHFVMPTIERVKIRSVREVIRAALHESFGIFYDELQTFSEIGYRYVTTQIIEPLLAIKGSYFGVLQGRWPIHLLSASELPKIYFENSDELFGKITRNEGGVWGFSPTNVGFDDVNWFRLEFNLPEEVAFLIEKAGADRVEILNVKKQYFSYIDLSGVIGGVQRLVKLKLDRGWTDNYLDLLKSQRSGRRE